MKITPFAGVSEFEPDDPQYSDLLARAAAVCTTEALLKAEGVQFDDLETSIEDRKTAEVVVQSYAKDPVKTSKVAKIDDLSTPSLLLTSHILKEFGQAMVATAQEIRTLVTNKLIIESENPDPKIRVRSLELLGKMTDVGLFTERKHVVVTQQTPEEVAAKLRDRLEKVRTLVQLKDGSYAAQDKPDDFEPAPLSARAALAELLG